MSEVERIAKRLHRRALLAADSRHWYREANRTITERRGFGAGLWIGCFAATSPRALLQSNVTLADRAYRLIARGQDVAEGAPYGLAGPSTLKNLQRVARGEPLSGPKVEPFRRALLGDPSGVPIDVWMLRAAYGDDRAATPRRTRDVQAAVKVVARRLDWEPREVQAAAWAGERMRKRPLLEPSLSEVLSKPKGVSHAS